jgi:hypothetical protein
VKRLSGQLENRAHVMRVDIHSEVGREVMQHYGISGVPAFIIFDSAGQIVWRGSSVPSVEEVLGEG